MSKKKKRTTVNAPFYIPQVDKIPDIEKDKFFKFSRKIRGNFSKFMITMGFLLCIVSSTYFLTIAELPLHNPFLLDAIVLLGIINLLCGLFLLATE
ncbi:MAG: hypothetical protein ACOC6G_03660 [Thermoproteota archaeon]